MSPGVPGFVNEGGQCQPTRTKGRHLSVAVPCRNGRNMYAERRAETGFLARGSPGRPIPSSIYRDRAGYTVHPELSGRPSAPLAQATHRPGGSMATAITPPRTQANPWDCGSRPEPGRAFRRNKSRGTRAVSIRVGSREAGGKRFHVSKKGETGLSCVPGSTVQ